MELKDIKIGKYIQIKVEELNMPIERICNFFKVDEKTILEMYKQEELSTNILLRWCKLLEYDFFRLYSQHLIFYSPGTTLNLNTLKEKPSVLPQFRKNIYTQEIIQFILELIETKKKTKLEVIEEYKIPKTTLYKWISKYKKKTSDQ